jgi:hypothetical protein
MQPLNSWDWRLKMTETDVILICSFIVPVILCIITWRPLRKRFIANTIIMFYMSLSVIGVSLVAQYPFYFFLGVFHFCLAIFSARERPEPKILVNLFSPAVTGDWELLASKGVPEYWIEKLKKMNPYERVSFMNSLCRPVDEILRKKKRKQLVYYSEDKQGFVTNGYGMGRMGFGFYEDGTCLSDSDSYSSPSSHNPYCNFDD